VAVVTEYAERGDLESLLRVGGLTLKQRMKVARDILAAVHHLHSRNPPLAYVSPFLIKSPLSFRFTTKSYISRHYDVSPSNILITAQGIAKLGGI